MRVMRLSLVKLVHTAVRGPGAHDELVPWYLRYRVTYCGTSTATVPRERNLLALPTLDMYLPLSNHDMPLRLPVIQVQVQSSSLTRSLLVYSAECPTESIDATV